MTETKVVSRPSCLARGLAAILGFLLILLLPLSLLLFNLEQAFFDPPTVTRILTDEMLHSDLIPAMLAWFSEYTAEARVASGEAQTWVEEPDIVQLLSFVDREAWAAIRQEVLADEAVSAWVAQAVNGFYNWIDSQDASPQIHLDLQPLKTSVDGEGGQKSLLIAYAELPPCTQEQIDDFEARLNAAPPDTEVFYNLCQFPDPWREDQFNDYAESLDNLVENVPDAFVLSEALAENPDMARWLETLKGQLRLLRLVGRWGWLVPLILLLLILALAVRSLKTLGNLWGAPLLLGGLLSLLPALVYRWLITSLFNARLLGNAPEAARAEMARAVARLLAEAQRPLLLHSLALAGLGLLLVVIGSLARPKKNAAPSKTGSGKPR